MLSPMDYNFNTSDINNVGYLEPQSLPIFDLSSLIPPLWELAFWNHASLKFDLKW